jgi:uncharacterized membrane protein YeaQ/YmgE (transglycosylase-associated protein family)
MLWTILIGLIAGALAKVIMPGRDPGGIFVTILLGVAGALLANFLGRQFGWYDTTEKGAGLIAATVGALVILWIYRMAVRRKPVNLP